MTDTSALGGIRPLEPNDTETLAFHRLGRASSRYRWWRPVAVGFTALGLFVLSFAVLFGGIAVVGLFFPELRGAMDEFSGDVDNAAIDMNDPFTFTVLMISLILMFPALGIANRILGARPFGLLSSVTGRLRWGWFARCMGIAIAVFGFGYIASFAVTAIRGEPGNSQAANPQLLTMIALTMLLVPFQAAAEEYVFRGYLMQTIGGWLRHPVFAIALPMPLFVLGHDYQLLGMIDIGVFAIVAGWLSWRTGGLEAAIALHIVNNGIISVLGAVGLVDVNATGLGAIDLFFSLVITLAFAIVVTRTADRHKIEPKRTARPAR